MKEPRVTILIPTIGRMKFLPETRACVEAQVRRDVRIVILDNESPPDARAFFDDWARADTRIEVVRAEPRVPMFDNFNRGILACKTEFFTFFHDDDVYGPRYLEVLVGALERHPTASFSGSNFDFVDEEGRVTERRRWITKTALWSGSRYASEVVGRGRNPVPMPGLVFRRSSFPSAFDTSLPIHFGDFVLLMRAAEQGGMVACKESVVSLRRHAGQASAMKLSASIALRSRLLSAYLDEFHGRHPDESDLVAHLRSRIRWTHRAAMVWGWMSSEDHAERDACLEALGSERLERATRAALRIVDRTGLRPARLGTRVHTAARAAAEKLGI